MKKLITLVALMMASLIAFTQATTIPGTLHSNPGITTLESWPHSPFSSRLITTGTIRPDTVAVLILAADTLLRDFHLDIDDGLNQETTIDTLVHYRDDDMFLIYGWAVYNQFSTSSSLNFPFAEWTYLAGDKKTILPTTLAKLLVMAR